MRHQLLKEYYEGPEYMNKLLARLEVLKKCEAEPLEINRLAIESWSVDPVTFVEQFGWISIPEYQNEIKPFFLFPYQKNILVRLWEAELSGEDTELLIDKPRGMGLTWIIVWYQIWRWLFTPRWGGFNLSRTETEVDDGTSDPNSSIFGKFRWCLSMLPQYLLPEGYQPKGKKGTNTDSILRITNPQLGSSLVGSTTNANAGRSRRYSFTFVDECFAIERFRLVYSSLQSVSRTKVFVSTVKAGKVFQDFKDMAELAGNYVSLKWSDHPFKDQTWYEEQIKKAEFDPEVMKEIEVDYAVNIRSQYYPEIREAKIVQGIDFIRGKPLFVSMDYGQQDRTVLIYWQFDGQFINILECVSNSRKPLDWYVPYLNPELNYNPEFYLPHQKEILDKVRGWGKAKAFFGEAAFFKAESDNKSVATKLNQYGIRIIINQYAIAYEPRRKATSQLLKRTNFNGKSDGVMELYDSLANSRYANAVKGVSRESALKPVHDNEIGDFRSAAENFYVNFPRVARNQRTEVHTTLKENNFIGGLTKYLRI
jgi:hypothetical protein